MTNPIIPVFDGHNDLPWESRDNRHYSVEGIDQELPQTLTSRSCAAAVTSRNTGRRTCTATTPAATR